MKGIKLKVWKEGKRLLSMALSAALIVGTLAGAAVPVVDVQAAEVDEDGYIVSTYDFADLTKDATKGNLSYVDNADGSTDVTYNGQYQSLFVEIPDEVDVENLDTVQVNVASENGGNLAYKIFTNAQFNENPYSDGSMVNYGNPVMSVAGLANKQDLGYFVVMSLMNQGVAKIASVTFKCREAKPVDAKFSIEELGYTCGDGVSATVISDNGTVQVDYSGNYKSIYMKIPRTVNKKTLVGITFGVQSVSSNNVSANNVACKVLTQAQFDAKEGEGAVNYGGNVITDFSKFEEDAPAYVAVMSCYNGDGNVIPQDTPVELILSDVTFTFFPDGTENRFIEEDMSSLYQEVAAQTDEKVSMGVAVPVGALNDPERMKLVYKHYNSLTCENEMKPESILGSAEPGVSNIEDVKLNFANADAMMDAVVSANDAHIANIKVRGHVFVWHSQTPTWFFREGLKSNGAYVEPEEMNERMEWYIKSVAQHFDTKYPGLIYAWDVVNEAANDGGGPRTNGDWYGVYQSWDFIPKAFEYADEYLDEDTILFYNDYNECTPTKCDQIVEFLTEIREHIDPDRKLGAGMQGHHDMATPTLEMIEAATRAYAEVADVVHITELDVKSTMGYVDSPEARVVEYTQQGHRYKEIYNMVKRVNADMNDKVTNITIWGTDDKNSWLKTSNSVGGSADGKTPQFPLLFDEDLKVKPAYWAFVDQSKLEPAINAVNAMNTDDPKYASENVAKKADGTAWFKFKSYWANGKLYFSVDDTVSGNDVKLYTDIDGNGTPEGPVAFENGVASVDIDDLGVKQTYLFDIVVDGDAYNDTKGSYASTSEYYAKVTTKPLMQLAKGTAYVDGDVSDWEDVEGVELTEKMDNPEANVEAKVCWDEENLYVLMDVKDKNLDATSGQVHEKDSMEVFIDELNEKAGGYDANDKQYRVNYLNEQSFNGTTCTKENIDSAVELTEDGYVVEAAIKWTALEAKPGEMIGLDLQINDGKGGTRIGTRNWYDTSGNGWQNPGVFGTAVLVDAVDPSEEDVAKAEAADDAAEAIGDVAYTAASKAKIDAAVKAYADMTVAQRLLVAKDTLTTIKVAQAFYNKLDDEVKAAEEAIAAIGKVGYTEDSLKAIEAAKAACKGLDDDQKAAMKSALDTLAAAEKAYETAKSEYLASEENKKKDAAAVKDVTDKIKAIGTVTYDAAVKAKIDEARKAYDALTQAQKDQIPADVLKILTDAEATYKAEAEKAEQKEEPKVKYFAKFSVKSIPIKKGQSSKALAKDIKIAKGDKITKWTSSKPKIVSVDKKTGKIKGKKVGKAKITAYTKSGKKATITVVVQKNKVAATKITLTNKSTGKAIKKNATIKLKKGKSMTVVANVKPMTCTEKVKFTSSNKKVATVSSKGKIRAKKTGTTTITAKVGKKSIKFKVKVVKK